MYRTVIKRHPDKRHKTPEVLEFRLKKDFQEWKEQNPLKLKPGKDGLYVNKEGDWVYIFKEDIQKP